jgi:hypothetical protein
MYGKSILRPSSCKCRHAAAREARTGTTGCVGNWRRRDNPPLHERSRGHGEASCKRVKALQALFAWAMGADLVRCNPTLGVRKINIRQSVITASRNGDGMNFERRPVKHSAMLVYSVGRSYLLKSYHSLLQSGRVRIVDGPASRRAYEQLMALETEMRENGPSTVVRRDSTMISAYHAPCWRGRHAIRICARGSTWLCRRAGRPGRVKHMAGQPSRKHSPRARQNLVERPACSARK